METWAPGHRPWVTWHGACGRSGGSENRLRGGQTEHRGTKLCLTHQKQEDWTKPAAMAIPKGGYFEDKVEQGRYGPIFPKTPACYGFSVIAKVIPGREEHIYNHAKVIEKAIANDPDHARDTPGTLPEVGDLHHQGRELHDVSGHLRYRFRQILRRCLDPLREDRHRHRPSRPSRDGRRTRRPTLRPSSSSSANTSGRASSNTANIPTSRCGRNQESAHAQAAFSSMLDQMQ